MIKHHQYWLNVKRYVMPLQRYPNQVEHHKLIFNANVINIYPPSKVLSLLLSILSCCFVV
jgi:hypothetical protein